MFEYWMKTDLRNMPEVNRVSGHFFAQDGNARKIGAVVTNGGEPVELQGNVFANVIRADGMTLIVAGWKEGNRAYVILPREACAAQGKIRIFLKIAGESSVSTIGAAEGTVYPSMTSEVIS